MIMIKKTCNECANEEIMHNDSMGYYIVNKKFATKHFDRAILCNSVALHELNSFEEDSIRHQNLNEYDLYIQRNHERNY